MSKPKTWRCEVCGHIHEGDAPPDHCPVCGVPASMFKEVDEPAEPEEDEAPSATPTKTWRCTVCGYIHQGDAPPDECPVCGAAAKDFEAVETRDAAQAVEPSAPSTQRIVIVGGGIAGLSAAESAREASPEAEIVLLSAEGELPYYRLNLTRYLAGELDDDTLPVHPAKWYEEQRIDVRLGMELATIDTTGKAIELTSGDRVEYDKLVIATGAHPFVPPIPGRELPHVHTLRTANEAKAILTAVKKGMQVVCIGGGILGLETAGALARHGAGVTVLESFDHLMPRQLNSAGSEVLAKHLYTLGIDVMTQVQAERIDAKSVELSGGSILPADLVVIMVGVRANTGPLAAAGLPVRFGVLVDNYMRTSNPDVLAAGDVCEHDGVMYGSWAAAQFQGKIAGMNAAGSPTQFGGIPRSHSLKVLGKNMFSIGEISSTDGSYRMIDEAGDDYRMFMLHDEVLVGALLIGDTGLMQACRKAIEERRPLGTGATAADVAAQLAE